MKHNVMPFCFQFESLGRKWTYWAVDKYKCPNEVDCLEQTEICLSMAFYISKTCTNPKILNDWHFVFQLVVYIIILTKIQSRKLYILQTAFGCIFSPIYSISMFYLHCPLHQRHFYWVTVYGNLSLSNNDTWLSKEQNHIHVFHCKLGACFQTMP